ncbi:MAG: signal peptidase II [Gemmatimonadaceae bacterium]
MSALTVTDKSGRDSSELDSSRNGAVAVATSNTSPGMFWGIVVSVIALDVVTKSLAVEHLMPRHVPHNIIGDFVRFTLANNPGAAFGFNLGPASRWIFAALSIVIVVALLRWTRQLVAISKFAAIGVPIVIGGALGNLLDRVRFREGVVDFIDVGVGNVRFWTFNVADAAVTVGAACLVIALWRHEEKAS